MRNIRFSSRETDSKALAVIGALAVSGIIGYLLPTPVFPGQILHIQIIDAIIAIGLAVFVWSVFRLVEPRRYGQRWMVAKIIGIPFVWLLLVVALALLFYHSQKVEEHLIFFFDTL